MNKSLMKAGEFWLSRTVPYRMGDIMCSDKTFVSEKYGCAIREIRDLHKYKLYHISVEPYKNDNKVLSINILTSYREGKPVIINGFEATVPSGGCTLNNLTMKTYRDMIDRTAELMNMLSKYYC